jgi:hypothetical protein
MGARWWGHWSNWRTPAVLVQRFVSGLAVQSSVESPVGNTSRKDTEHDLGEEDDDDFPIPADFDIGLTHRKGAVDVSYLSYLALESCSTSSGCQIEYPVIPFDFFSKMFFNFTLFNI